MQKQIKDKPVTVLPSDWNEFYWIITVDLETYQTTSVYDMRPVESECEVVASNINLE